MPAPKEKVKDVESQEVIEFPQNALLIKSSEQDGTTIEQRGFMVYQGVVIVDTEVKDGVVAGVKIRFSRDAAITPVTIDGVVVSGDLSERS